MCSTEGLLIGSQNVADRVQYVVQVKPKIDNKFVYRGKIWVDAQDFAVTRIEAEPAKSPSFWVKKSEINHVYEKVDSFWLPAQNKTESWIRLGGHASLSIEYTGYKILGASESDKIQNVGDDGGLHSPGSGHQN